MTSSSQKRISFLHFNNKNKHILKLLQLRWGEECQVILHYLHTLHHQFWGKQSIITSNKFLELLTSQIIVFENKTFNENNLMTTIMIKVLWYIYYSNHIHTNEWISFLKRHVDFHWYSVPFILKVHPHQGVHWPINVNPTNTIYFLNLMVKNGNPTYLCLIIKWCWFHIFCHQHIHTCCQWFVWHHVIDEVFPNVPHLHTMLNSFLLHFFSNQYFYLF